jgi:hypothetical protein
VRSGEDAPMARKIFRDGGTETVFDSKWRIRIKITLTPISSWSPEKAASNTVRK